MSDRFEKLKMLQKEYTDLQKVHFFRDVLFTYQWWVLLLTTIFVFVIWFFLVDKRQIKSILIVGFMASLLALLLDDIGLSVAAWSYPYRLFYFSSRLNPVDIGVIPVAYMLLYQYLRNWKLYLFGNLLFSLFASFIAEPLFVMMNIYEMYNWDYWYSLPIYFVIGVMVKSLAHLLNKRAIS